MVAWMSLRPIPRLIPGVNVEQVQVSLSPAAPVSLREATIAGDLAVHLGDEGDQGALTLLPLSHHRRRDGHAGGPARWPFQVAGVPHDREPFGILFDVYGADDHIRH